MPRSPSGRTGSHPAGSPFLWLLSFGEAKESDSPAGAKSRLRNPTLSEPVSQAQTKAQPQPPPSPHSPRTPPATRHSPHAPT
ncbi:hypothetical protein C8239_13175 [Paracidovorax avenae]|nr:hypothetical protein C8239_13175 [Paracidovorax avenae]